MWITEMAETKMAGVKLPEVHGTKIHLVSYLFLSYNIN